MTEATAPAGSQPLPGRTAGRLAGAWGQARAGWRGFLVSALIAGTSAFIADHYGGPSVLYALLIGLACSFLREDARIRPGLDLSSRFVLRLGVALLGARIAADQVAALGFGALLTVMIAMSVTFLVAIPVARLLGFGRDFALLSATATAVCGVSAALTAASILPKTASSDRDTAFVALAVTLLSTVAMVIYPILATAAFDGPIPRGVFLGAAIHDVAQVVAAGFLLGEPTGDAAVVTKLARVAMLVPVSILLSLHVGLRVGSPGTGEPMAARIRRLLTLPWFLVLFMLLAVLNSVHVLPVGTGDALSPASRACLVIAIAAIGMKTGVKQMVDMGWRATLLLVLLTLAIAVAASAGVHVLIA